MPTESIPFANLMSGHESLGGASPSAINVAVDENGVVRRRPGIQTLASAGAGTVDSDGISGIHVTVGGTIFAVGGTAPVRTLYKVNGGASAAVGGTSMFVGPLRPHFAETEALLVVAAGSAMHKLELASNSASALGGSPPDASHVIFNASRLIANDVSVDRSKVNYSDPAISTVFTGHETWGGSGSSGFFSAEAKPDPVVALGENSNEVFVWGATNLEVYGPDAYLVFGRATARDYGCVAPYSVTRYDDTFVWLDSRRRFIQSDGRTIQDISGPIGPLLDALDTVSDCFGYRVTEGPLDCLVFTFPSDGETFSYQVGVGWSKWASFSGGQWGAFPVNAHAQDPVSDANVVGLSSGRVAQLSDGAVDDLGDPINAFVETGAITRGTSARKLCSEVRFALERGRTSSSPEPIALVQWADRPGAWNAPRPISLGRSGDTRAVVTLRGLGLYRTRYWRFTFSTGEHMALASAEEDYEIMRE